jgi:hypothetical protein
MWIFDCLFIYEVLSHLMFCIYIRSYKCTFKYMNVCMYIYMYMNMNTCINVLYIYTNVCVYIHIYEHIYIIGASRR